MEEIQYSLLIIGIVSLIAAIVGGNLKLPGAQFGPLESTSLRFILAMLGVLLTAGSFFLPSTMRLSSSFYGDLSPPTRQTYLAQLDASCDRISTMLGNLGEPRDHNATIEYITNRLTIYRDYAAQWGRLVFRSETKRKLQRYESCTTPIRTSGRKS